jgi:cephalosporin hydroxylase
MDMIYPVKGTIETLKSYVGETFRFKFAFIDGEHGYQTVCNDIDNIEPYLVSGAWICFDDAFVSFHGVSRAIKEKIIENPKYTDAQQLTRKLFVARFNP